MLAKTQALKSVSKKTHLFSVERNVKPIENYLIVDYFDFCCYISCADFTTLH